METCAPYRRGHARGIGYAPAAGNVTQREASAGDSCRRWQLGFGPSHRTPTHRATRCRRNHRGLSIADQRTVETMHPRSGGGGGNRTRVRRAYAQLHTAICETHHAAFRLGRNSAGRIARNCHCRCTGIGSSSRHLHTLWRVVEKNRARSASLRMPSAVFTADFVSAIMSPSKARVTGLVNQKRLP